MLIDLFKPDTIRKLLLLFLVAGMASFSRDFAYLSLGNLASLPIYVTEFVLGVSLYLDYLEFCVTPEIRGTLKTVINTPLAMYWFWGLVLLGGALPLYRADAIRDFVVVYYSLFIFVTIAALRTINDVEHLLYVIVVANLFFVATVILRISRGDYEVWGEYNYLRVGEGTQGLFSVIGFVITLVLFLEQRKRWFLLLLPLFLIGIMGPQHRSLILAFAGALSVLFLTLSWHGKSRLALVLGIVIVSAIVLVIIVPNGVAVVSGQLPKYLAFFDSEEGSNAARMINYQAAIDEIITSPISGVGFGTPWFFDYGSQELAPVRAPHDSYLGITFRSGMVGLVLFLFFLLNFYGYVIRKLAKISNVKLRGYAAAILAAQVAVAIVALFNVTLEGPHGGVIFWILIGAELRVLQLSAESDCQVLEREQSHIPPIVKFHKLQTPRLSNIKAMYG